MPASPSSSGFNVLSGAARSSFSVARMSVDAPLASQVGSVSGAMRLQSPGSGTGLPGGLTGGLAGSGAGAPVRQGNSNLAVIGAATDYLENLSGPIEAVGKQQAVTSLVPTQPGEYRDYMETGEKAFSAGDFNRAKSQFLLANRIGMDDPESCLSLAHADFATGSYSSACFHLCQAIKNFPELPVLQLKPQKFYGDEKQYLTHLQRLEDHIQKIGDPGGYLLEAYFRWFEGSTSEAQRAIFQAYRLSKKRAHPYIAEAAEIFWDGMVATGKVSGTLDGSVPAKTSSPTTTRAAETKPADAEK